MALPKNLLLQDILKIYFSTTLTLKHQSLPFKELYYIFLQEIEYPSPVKICWMQRENVKHITAAAVETVLLFCKENPGFFV